MKTEIKPYEGLARATEIVAEVCGTVEPGWLAGCEPLDPNKEPPTEEEILEWSEEFGTMAHALCLEGARCNLEDQRMTEMLDKAFAYFNQWKDEYQPARIKVEQEVVHPDNLYGGTVDKFCRIDGDRWLVDLKMYGWWKEKFEYKPSKDIFPSRKAVKVNLQTSLYNATQKRPHRRGCLVIHPDGYYFHEFQRESTKLPEALEVAKTISRRSDKYHLTEF